MDHQADQRTQIGHYRLVRELGRGSMGTVYLAHQESLGRDLAVKVLAPEFTRDPEFVERFKREGRVTANLRHPNIVRIFDADCQDGLYYIAMEYMGDGNLRQLLQSTGKLPLSRSLKIIGQILLALDHAHSKGVVHRDVKPANVLIPEDDEVALTDFSIAHIKSASRLTRTGVMLGTPEYMAPEQFDGRKIDGRADLYAAGLILYEMLTGRNPFHGETTPEVMKAHIMLRAQDPCALEPSIPVPVGTLILKALEKNPDDRFQTASQMRDELLRAAGHDPSRSSMEDFLASIARGEISMDEAIKATDMVKEAIDRGFKKRLSVMMVDLAGSSRIKLPNQTLVADQAFRDYRATINAILGEQGCHDYDWSGDGAICLFQEASQAVTAALRIQSVVAEVAARHQQLPARLLARIGINTGDVYLDPRRSLGEFASRTVDQAGHLEKDCPPGQVHVSESTARLTEGLVVYQQVGVNRDGVTVFSAVSTTDGSLTLSVPASPTGPAGVLPPPAESVSPARTAPPAAPQDRREVPRPVAAAAAPAASASRGAGMPSQSPLTVLLGFLTGGQAAANNPVSPVGATDPDEFQLWRGWWVGALSFLLVAASGGQNHPALYGFGMMGMTVVIGWSLVVTLICLGTSRGKMARQPAYACGVFCLLFVIASVVLRG